MFWSGDLSLTNKGLWTPGFLFSSYYYWGLPYGMQMRLWLWPPTQHGCFPQWSVITVFEIPPIRSFSWSSNLVMARLNYRCLREESHILLVIWRAAAGNLMLALPETNCYWQRTENRGVPAHPSAGKGYHVGILGTGVSQGLEFPFSGPQMSL